MIPEKQTDNDPTSPAERIAVQLEKKTVRKLESAARYAGIFAKWLFISGIVGLISGGVGCLFHIAIDYATQTRVTHPSLIFLLPFCGLFIIAMYHMSHLRISTGTDDILNSLYTTRMVSIVLAPLIFISSVLTHLFGGSAGREGAALQLGGCLGIPIGRLFRLDPDDMSLVILCGMSGVFSSLFGLPLTSTFFPMELMSVGLICYPCLVPCLFSAIVGYFVSLYCGFAPSHFLLTTAPDISIISVGQTAGLSILCALVSILFCVAITHSGPLFAKAVKNDYLRVFLGGSLVALLTWLAGSYRYNGTGFDIIVEALDGHALPGDFIMKIIFTAITLGVGFKGGAIIPAFFVGATFGCVTAHWFGLDPGFGAAIGLVAVFCASVNCPVTAMILSIEFFGSDYIILFTVACSVSYMLSGYYSLFSSQSIIYSKLKAELINIHAK